MHCRKEGGVYVVQFGLTERACYCRHVTRAEARKDLFDCIELFYNRKRRHPSIGYHIPGEVICRVDDKTENGGLDVMSVSGSRGQAQFMAPFGIKSISLLGQIHGEFQTT